MSGRVLDASAMLAYFNRQERGHPQVVAILEDRTRPFCAHAINLEEVYERILRRVGAYRAEQAMDQLLALGVEFVSDMDPEFWKDLAWLKVNYMISLGDAAGQALARRRKWDLVADDDAAFLGPHKAGILKLERFR